MLHTQPFKRLQPAPTPTPQVQPAASSIALEEQTKPLALSTEIQNATLLPIEEDLLPPEDIGDFSDVVDAINRLCDTMKTSSYDDPSYADDETEPELTECYEEEEVCEEIIESQLPETFTPYYVEIMENVDDISVLEPVVATEYCEVNVIYPSNVSVHNVEPCAEDKWSDSVSLVRESLPGQVETVEPVAEMDAATGQWDAPCSEMYYTASSEISLVSDYELPDRGNEMEDSICFTSDILNPLAWDGDSSAVKEEKKSECVILGHVAAMRERFENMTRANTPCPDLNRSLSPSLDRIVTPSPDLLGS